MIFTWDRLLAINNNKQMYRATYAICRYFSKDYILYTASC